MDTHLSPDDDGLRKEGNARKERVPTIRELPDYYIRKVRMLRTEGGSYFYNSTKEYSPTE